MGRTMRAPKHMPRVANTKASSSGPGAKKSPMKKQSAVSKTAAPKAAPQQGESEQQGAAPPASQPQAATGGEIDELFGKLKDKKKQADKPAGPDTVAQAQVAAVKEKPKRVEGNKDDLFGTETAGRKRTEEGFVIYSEEELGFGKKGGDTDKCPFDCECCF